MKKLKNGFSPECLSSAENRAIIEIMEINGAYDASRIKQMSPIVLAFVGDAVYTLFVRKKLALESGYKTGELNRLATEIISAHGQSDSLARILPFLTEEESEIYHRGRNAKKLTKSKNASAVEYARSTGLEAVIGYLHLTGRDDRIYQLLFSEKQ